MFCSSKLKVMIAAALLLSGARAGSDVHVWGHADYGGFLGAEMQAALNASPDISHVASTDLAFMVRTTGGVFHVWGHAGRGGSLSAEMQAALNASQARFADAGASPPSPPVCWRGDADDDQRVADEILGAQLQQAPQGEATDRLADPHGGPITCSINLATTPADTVRALVLVPAPAVYA
jgi:hypothetical protein